jgi:hypothetical protein
MGGSCSSIDYGDTLDTMGMVTSPRHFNAVQKELLGWLGYNTSPPITQVDSTGVYTLDPIETAGTNPKALKIATPAGDWYYVEYRRPIGYDTPLSTNGNVVNGVVVHYWTGQLDGVYLLDMTPATASWNDPALGLSATFSDPVRGITITPAWVGGATAGVNVTVGGACVRNNPSVSVAPAQQQGEAGSMLTFTVTVRNNDTGCGTSVFTTQPSLPAGWSGVIAATSLTMAPGSTTQLSLQVTSAPGAVEGPYPIPVSATNAAFPGFTATASATYSVLAPAGGGGGGGGGEIAVGGAAGTLADDFNRPDVSPLDNGWTAVSGALSLQAGEVRSAATRMLHMAIAPSLAGRDGSVQASFASTDNNAGPRFGVVLRYQDPSNYYVCYRTAGGSSSAVIISRIRNGVETILKSATVGNPVRNAYFSLACSASGTSLTLQLGTVKITAADATFASGSVGFLMGYPPKTGTVVSHRADNFIATMQ